MHTSRLDKLSVGAASYHNHDYSPDFRILANKQSQH